MWIFPLTFDKTQLRQILLWLEKDQKMKIFTKIAEKTPSPGLWKGQTAENELDLRYEDIDKVLYSINEKKIRNAKMITKIAGVEKEKVIRIIDMMHRNEHKNRLPPSPPVRYFK